MQENVVQNVYEEGIAHNISVRGLRSVIMVTFEIALPLKIIIDSVDVVINENIRESKTVDFLFVVIKLLVREVIPNLVNSDDTIKLNDLLIN